MPDNKLTDDHFFSYASPISEKANRNFLNRFFHRVGTSFGLFKPQTCSKLAGRIRVMQQTAVDIVAKLKRAQKELEGVVDKELYRHIQDVIRPLIREIEKVNLQQTDTYRSVTQQAHVFQRYSEWVERAKGWLQLSQCSKDREVLAKAVRDHIVEEVCHSIERDLCLIVDYKRHVVAELTVGESKKKMIKQRLGRALKPLVNSLQLLQKKPGHKELEEVAEWRSRINQKRQEYHDHALSVIDQIVDQYQKGIVTQEEHHHLVEVLEQLIFLEEAVPLLIAEVKSGGDTDREEWVSRLESLEQEAYHLNLDLRLPHDLIKRLHKIISRLEELRAIFN